MLIYFDQAASSWPKPDGVAQAMLEAVRDFGANPGRGGHQLSVKAGRVVEETRASIARLFAIRDARDVIFTSNATGALNQAIKGFTWNRGDEIIATTYEHNAVRRPLEFLRQHNGVRLHYIQPDVNGRLDLDVVEQTINEHTKLIVATHVSNLTGVILPVAELGQLASQHNIPFLVDASQSAGVIPIDVQAMNIDLLAFPGHKGLYGPQGTGALYIAPHLDLQPLIHGGTGSYSELADQPAVRPLRYESGTLNTPGIAGWQKGIQFVEEQGVPNIWEHEQALTRYALEALKQIKDIMIYGPDEHTVRAPVISINIAGIDPQELAAILDEHYDIAVRAGLHCAPLAHQSVQTDPDGSVRISFGFFNRREEIDQLIQALVEIRQGLLGR